MAACVNSESRYGWGWTTELVASSSSPNFLLFFPFSALFLPGDHHPINCFVSKEDAILMFHCRTGHQLMMGGTMFEKTLVLLWRGLLAQLSIHLQANPPYFCSPFFYPLFNEHFNLFMITKRSHVSPFNVVATLLFSILVWMKWLSKWIAKKDECLAL